MNLGVFLIFISIMTLVLAILTLMQTYRLRQLRSIRWLWALSSCFTIGPLATIAVVLAPMLEDKVFFFHVRVLGMVSLIGFWLLFVSAVFDRWRWLHRPWITMLILSPIAANFLLVAMPATRELIFFNFRLVSVYGLPLIQFNVGLLYKIFYAWSIFLLILSVVICGITAWMERGARRAQAISLNLGVMAAMVHGAVTHWLPDLRPADWLIVTGLSLFFNQAGILYAVMRHELLSLVPLAITRIFRRFPDPVFVVDAQGRLMDASDRAVSFFGLPVQFQGRLVQEILPRATLQPGEQTLLDAHLQPHPFHLVVEELGEGRNSPGRVIYFRDISVQKEREVSLREGMEFRARLLAFLAHDLTGFLESQAVLASSVQERVGSQASAEIDLLAQSAYASQELVGNVMAWVKGQARQFSVTARPFEWNLLLRETIEQLSSRFHAKGVGIEFRGSSGALLGAGDSEMLAAVVRNLLSNALRAAPQGSGVRVTLAEESKMAVVTVEDCGAGLAEEQVRELLAASSEFSLRGCPKAHGAGIGLMISRHFLHLHGGAFSLRSGLGAGTEAGFRVPL